jgi:hypothetical protein
MYEPVGTATRVVAITEHRIGTHVTCAPGTHRRSGLCAGILLDSRESLLVQSSVVQAIQRGPLSEHTG